MTAKIIACCALALALGACSSNKTETSSTTTSAPESMATAAAAAAGGMTSMAGKMMGAMHSMTVTIAAMNGSGETGTATLTPMGSKTSVVVSLKGENATGKQPAHIHLGTCAKLNPAPKYGLKDVMLGKSVTIVDASITELMSTPMAINVHESGADLQKYVACGDIKK